MCHSSPNPTPLGIFTLVLFLLSVCSTRGASEKACESHDFVRSFGPCLPGIQKRWVFEYVPVKFLEHQESKVCNMEDPLSLRPRDPFLLPCDFSCKDGQYYNGTGCIECEDGRARHGNEIVISSWNAWPPSFSTRCEQRWGSCEGWVLNGNSISSGMQRDDVQEVQSFLTWDFEFEESGTIRFEYDVDAEGTHDLVLDGFSFWIDGKLVKESESYSLGRTWSKPFPLARGYHRFEWVYSKDITRTVGSDCVRIFQIVLDDAVILPSQCDLCPPGTSPNIERSHCIPCPLNTMSGDGKKCVPCVDGYFSSEGSSSCTKIPKCTMDDLHVIAVTSCSKGTRNVTMDKRDGFTCHPLPPSIPNVPTTFTVDCPPCPDGKEFRANADTHSKCISCPAGYFRNATMMMCDRCPLGTSALQVLTLDDFYFLIESKMNSDGIFLISENERVRWKNVAVHNSVEQNGWYSEFDIVSNTFYLDSGHGRPRGSILSFTVEVEYYTLGNFVLAFQFMDIGDDESVLTIEIGSELEPIRLKKYGLFDYSHFTGGGTIPPGKYNITVSHQTNEIDSRKGRCRIYGMEFSGALGGGAWKCTPCPPGISCPEGANGWESCPPGTHWNEHGFDCIQCDSNTFTNQHGSMDCTRCGYGNIAIHDMTECSAKCRFDVLNYGTVDLSLLSSRSVSLPNDTLNQSNYILRFHPCLHLKPDVFDEIGLPSFAALGPSTGSDESGMIVESKGMMDHQSLGVLQELPSAVDVKKHDHQPHFSLALLGIGRSKVIIDFVCVENGEEVHAIMWNESSLTATIQWKTPFACPLCTMNDDFHLEYSKCSADGVRYGSFVRNNQSRTCINGFADIVSLSSSVFEELCQPCNRSHYYFIDGSCENGMKKRVYVWKEPKHCVDGIQLPASETHSCTSPSSWDFGSMSLFTIFSILFCGSAVIVVIWKSTRPNKKNVGLRTDEDELFDDRQMTHLRRFHSTPDSTGDANSIESHSDATESIVSRIQHAIVRDEEQPI
eukprot:TRINITY_DN5427_c0_g1_i1.p1 TRINITY_DN5427_c0_g1~~TRINITY_DN5427_c0_g1_i1.p1  ORF type:complete len:1006 (+),score=206.49 TRINITY_DN5427_c0_g1_i1:30-3047(+)